jgi:hypothetical protein
MNKTAIGPGIQKKLGIRILKFQAPNNKLQINPKFEIPMIQTLINQGQISLE